MSVQYYHIIPILPYCHFNEYMDSAATCHVRGVVRWLQYLYSTGSRLSSRRICVRLVWVAKNVLLGAGVSLVPSVSKVQTSIAHNLAAKYHSERGVICQQDGEEVGGVLPLG